MASIKILNEGVHSHTEDDKLKIESTISLILSNKKIIVDTGSFLSKDKIINGLSKEGLTPSDIDIVILTHIHIDHTINTYLFDKAKIFCKLREKYSGQYHIPVEGCLKTVDLLEKGIIDNDVNIILTPGHTEDHISVLVDTPEGKIVIAGDAIQDEEWSSLEKQPAEMLVWNLDQFNESRKKIIDMADYVVPGHGSMFKVKK